MDLDNYRGAPCSLVAIRQATVVLADRKRPELITIDFGRIDLMIIEPKLELGI